MSVYPMFSDCARPHGTCDEAMERAAAYANRHGRELERAEMFLQRAGWPCTFGVESVTVDNRALDYLNSGDTYNGTVCQEGERGLCFVSSWGDWFESAEAQYESDNDVIRCGYCGEFTPLCDKALSEPEGARHSWHETICESCGHNVGN